MTDTLENERAVIGDNGPPPESKLGAWKDHAEELRERSVGIVITNDEQAQLVAELVTDAKKAIKDVAASVKAERKPHNDAATAVSESYKPVTASLEAVRDAAVKVAGDWRAEQERKQQEDAAELRRIAAEKEAEAAKLAASADTTEADDIAKVRQADDKAKTAKMDFQKAKSAKVSSGGVRMMPRSRVTIEDRKALLIHVAKVADADLEAFLLGWAEKAERAGCDTIPGCNIERWKEAV